MGKSKDIVHSVAPEEMAGLWEASLTADSFARCLACADSPEERERWRKLWVSSQMALCQKLDGVWLKYGKKEAISEGSSRGVTPIMDLWGNRVIWREVG